MMMAVMVVLASTKSLRMWWWSGWSDNVGPGDSIVLNLYTLPRGELDGPQNLDFFNPINAHNFNMS